MISTCGHAKRARFICQTSSMPGESLIYKNLDSVAVQKPNWRARPRQRAWCDGLKRGTTWASATLRGHRGEVFLEKVYWNHWACDSLRCEPTWAIFFLSLLTSFVFCISMSLRSWTNVEFFSNILTGMFRLIVWWFRWGILMAFLRTKTDRTAHGGEMQVQFG